MSSEDIKYEMNYENLRTRLNNFYHLSMLFMAQEKEELERKVLHGTLRKYGEV